MTLSRRKAREAALRAAYQLDIGGGTIADAVLTMPHWADLSQELRLYAENVIRGIDENLDFINNTLSANLKEWSLDRLGSIERNMLRIAAYELLFVPDMPPAVSINEAIEITRKYSSDESAKFVNGVLGGVLAGCSKANWTPVPALEEATPEEESAPEETEVEVTPEEAEDVKKLGFWRIREEEN